MLYKKYNARGFSLIELLVTLAISILMVSAVLFRFDSFDSVVVLKSIAYEIALTVREAQVFAVSASGDTSGTFDTPYGVYIDSNSPNNYIFFEDSNNNLQYESGTDTIIETYTMNAKYQVSDLCVNSTCSKNSVSIVFQRPNFDPTITSSLPETNPISATIQVGMVDDPSITFSVLVGLTGQITVLSP